MILTPWKVIWLSNPPPLWNFLGLWPPHPSGISNSLRGGSLDIFWNHTLRFCNIISMFCWWPSWNKRFRSAHLVAVASCGRLRESNQMWPLSIFFGLSWLSSDIWVGNKPFNSKIFLEFDLQRKCGKSFAKLMRAWDSSWNLKTQDKVMRLGKSGKTWSPLNKRPFHIISSPTPAPNPPVGTIEFYLKKRRGILPIKVPTHLFI